MAKRKQKYSSGERRAYYIGVGLSMAGAGKDLSARRLSDSFGEKMSEDEFRSYQQGLLAPVRKPDMFKKKRQKGSLR